MPEHPNRESLAIFEDQIDYYKRQLIHKQRERAHRKLEMAANDRTTGVIDEGDLLHAGCQYVCSLMNLREGVAKHLTRLRSTATIYAVVLEIVHMDKCVKIVNKSAKVGTLLSILTGGTSASAPVLRRQRKKAKDRLGDLLDSLKEIEEWRKERGLCSLEDMAARYKGTMSFLEVCAAREEAIDRLQKMGEVYGEDFLTNFDERG